MAKQTYGLPYKGSKNKIAEWVISNLPYSLTRFIDLFAGGCAIAHAAILSGKYHHVVANDLTTYPQMFLDAAQGKYLDETRWISREDFFRIKDTDPYAAICFSFGNDCHTYAYSRQLEPVKKAYHYAIVHNDFSLMHEINPKASIEAQEKLSSIDNIRERMHTFFRILRHTDQQTHRLESLQRLQRLQSLQSLQVTRTDYRQVPIPKGATVYVDPPYLSTNTYKQAGTFDHQAFYDWLRTVPFPVYISEYTMPDDFTCIAQTERQCSMSANGKSQKSIEKLFIHNRWI